MGRDNGDLWKVRVGVLKRKGEGREINMIHKKQKE